MFINKIVQLIISPGLLSTSKHALALLGKEVEHAALGVADTLVLAVGGGGDVVHLGHLGSQDVVEASHKASWKVL